MPGIKVALGGATINIGRGFPDLPAINAALDVLEEHNVRIIDSAQAYGESERLIGEAGVAARGFIIDTKAKGGWAPGSSTQENILQGARESIKKLKVDKVDIFYLHAPDKEVPFEETCAGINDAFAEGLFERFGLSNFLASDVQKVYDVCKEKGYVLPTVYQGNYSPVARKQETVLFPTLRKLGMCFYAYSPLAGGFLTKTKKQIQDGVGRFDTSTPLGGMYATLYAKPSYLEALAEWESIADEAGCSKADLAYRWVTYNSPLKPENGDAIIVGASSLKQLKETLEGLDKGPLSEGAIKRIDAVWEGIKHEAGLDNFSLNS